MVTQAITVRLSDLNWYEVDGEMVGKTIAIAAEVEGKKLEYTGKWNVTHTPSGAAFSTGERKKTALAIARALVELGFDDVRATDYRLAAKTFGARRVQDFLVRAAGRPPEEVERIAQAVAGTRQIVRETLGTTGSRMRAASKPPKKSRERPKRPKAAPDLLALAKAARKGAA